MEDQQYQGVILVIQQNVGTHSEGRYPFLVMERDGQITHINIYREGQLPFNDPFFEPYDRQEVVITGYISMGFLAVKAIERVNREIENKEQA